MTETVETKATEETLKISALLAELIGTFLLTGAVIKLAGYNVITNLTVGFALALLVMIFGAISGAHLNPAITIALAINKKVSWVKAASYIIAQVMGALLALLVFKFMFDSGLHSALLSQGITNADIKKAGGSIKFVEQYASSMQTTKASLLSQLGLAELPNVVIAKGNEIFTMLAEVFGATIFGLGVGHAVYAEDKPMWETGFSVGFGLFAALSLAGSTAVLNPAVGLAIGAFETTGSNWWAGYVTYILMTVIGMYVGITAYRFLHKAALS